VTQPFPKLDGLSDHDRMSVLARHGLAAAKIARHLSRPYSPAVINRYVTKHVGPRVKGVNNSRQNQIGITDMPYVLEALRRMAKDRYTCELCLDSVPQGCMVHHTRYDGATVYDLMFVCGSRNLSRFNTGLA
jgi:hypothetical protein